MGRTAFTLIELLIVVIIIGILVATVMPQFAGRTQQARIQRAKTEIFGTLETALGMFEMDFGRYPDQIAQLWDRSLTPSWMDPDDYEARWNGPYIKRASIKGDEIMDPWGHGYYYESIGDPEGKSYILRSFGPDGQDGSDDDITTEGELEGE
jgi:general secretion pathway protein G